MTFMAELPDYKTKKPLNEEHMTKSEIIDFLAGAYDFAIRAVNNLDAESIPKEFAFAGKKLNKIQFLNLIQDHQAHHRAQLIVYLRLNQLKPPAYVGW